MQTPNRHYLTTAVVARMSAAPVTAHAAAIFGSVTDATGAQALGGAEVELVELRRTVRTAADGTFRFANVPAGTYTLETTYAGGVLSERSVSVAADGELRLAVALGDDSVEEVTAGPRQADGRCRCPAGGGRAASESNAVR